MRNSVLDYMLFSCSAVMVGALGEVVCRKSVIDYMFSGVGSL